MRIADGVNLGRFWLSMLKKYGRGVLDEDQIRWTVRAKDKEGFGQEGAVDL